jgi:iron(III) transport system substrate-binding protein
MGDRIMLKRMACVVSALVVGGTVLTGGEAQAQTPTAVEKFYADIYALPAAERQKRLEDAAKKESTVVLLSTTQGQRGLTHLRMFNTRYPYVKVERGELNSPQSVERLIAEETAGRHLSDGTSAGIPDMGSIINELPLIARYPTPATNRVLPQFRSLLDPQNRWLPWFTGEHGISYNTNLVKAADAPKAWTDLCNAKFKGQHSYDPSENVFLSGLYTMLGEDGMKKLLECIGKNDPLIQSGHTARMTLMLAGEHMVQGDGFLFYGTQLYQKNPDKTPFKVAYEAPIMINAEGFLINKNAPNPAGVALFADYLLDDETQKFIHSEFRGVMTLPHPFFPDNVQLVSVGLLDKPVRDRLRGYWDEYVGKKR